MLDGSTRTLAVTLALFAVLGFGAVPAFAANEHLTLSPTYDQAQIDNEQAIQYFATLTDQSGAPLVGKTIMFETALCRNSDPRPTDAAGQTDIIVLQPPNCPNQGNINHPVEAHFTVKATYINAEGTPIVSNIAAGTFFERRGVGAFADDLCPTCAGNIRVHVTGPAAGRLTAVIISGPGTGIEFHVLCGGSSGCSNGLFDFSAIGTNVLDVGYTNALGERISTQLTITRASCLFTGEPCLPDAGPLPGATPELDTLVLFGSALAGVGSYGWLRVRARRRR